jgi:tRNA 2-selenouridine synthase
MASSLSIDAFLTTPGLLLDVRSPAEHQQGHIPGAISLPLFSNEERAEVGTCYKQQGHEAAVELGLGIVGPKLLHFVQQAKQLTEKFSGDRCLRVHCWRGGMRSSSMAWLLETAGFQVTLLAGGYKTYRQWVHQVLATPKPVLTLGGMTGTGKTGILMELSSRGEQTLDLEALANHRGSSYGNLGLPPQPSTEQFENLLALEWVKMAVDRLVWIEAESRMVGTCRVPDSLFQQMVSAPVVQVLRSRPDRVAILLEVYGTADRTELIAATERLRKRLGGQQTQATIAVIQAGDLTTAIGNVLDYYDKAYCYDLQRRQVPIHSIDAIGLSTPDIATRLIEQARALSPSLLPV